MTETIDLLKIIAGESGRLSAQDRETIRNAARELDEAYRHVARANEETADHHQQIAALMERNGEMERRITDLECQTASDACKLASYRSKDDNRQAGPAHSHFPWWSMGSGPQIATLNENGKFDYGVGT